MPDGPPSESSTPAVLTSAVRQAARFDRGMVSGLGGLLAAVPVVAVLGLGIAAGSPVAGVTMGAGAMLVGIAWRVRGGRPPLALMATDAVVMALSTFVGCVTGSMEWLHLGVLAVWALTGGLLIALGPGGGVLGTQAVLAAIVFGRFSQPAPAALALAGLVLAGGGAQVLFLTVFRWPSALRTQRQAVAAAYRALAELARDISGDTPTLPVGAALDEAEAALSAPALLGDPALMTLRSLVNEGRRIRVELIAIRALLSQARDGAPERDHAGTATPASAAHALELAAGAITGDRVAGQELVDTELWPRGAPEIAGVPPSLARPLSRRLAALGGQLRAVAGLAGAAGEGGGLRSRRPLRGSQPLGRLRRDLATLRANASLESPAGRHAVRLAVVVVGIELVARHLPIQRSYWMVLAAATTLRPEFGATFTRGAERALGTVLGVGLAGAITVGLHPAGGATVALVGALAWAAYAVFPASFAAGFGFITATVVFLLNAVSPDTLATANARLLDTLAGGAVGLIVYALWPTWARQPARRALADLVGAEREYTDAVLAAVIAGRPGEPERLRSLGRRVRLSRTTAESAVATSLSEPHTRRIDADMTRGTLAAVRRLVYAVSVLRLDAEDEQPHALVPALAPLAAAVGELLAAVERSLRDEATPARPLPDLRAAYEAVERVVPDDEEGSALLAQLDEIVDAANSLAAVIGLERADSDRPAVPA